MDNGQYFIAKDYLRAFDLKSLFVKYSVIYSQIHYPDSNEPLSSKFRQELSSQLQDVMNEMTLLVLSKKNAKSRQLYAPEAFDTKSLVSKAPPLTMPQASRPNQLCN